MTNRSPLQQAGPPWQVAVCPGGGLAWGPPPAHSSDPCTAPPKRTRPRIPVGSCACMSGRKWQGGARVGGSRMPATRDARKQKLGLICWHHAIIQGPIPRGSMHCKSKEALWCSPAALRVRSPWTGRTGCARPSERPPPQPGSRQAGPAVSGHVLPAELPWPAHAYMMDTLSSGQGVGTGAEWGCLGRAAGIPWDCMRDPLPWHHQLASHLLRSLLLQKLHILHAALHLCSYGAKTSLLCTCAGEGEDEFVCLCRGLMIRCTKPLAWQWTGHFRPSFPDQLSPLFIPC